jgi:hypothetical protein
MRILMELININFGFIKMREGGPGSSVDIAIGYGLDVPGVESGRGVTLTPKPLLLPRSKNRVELYLYSR